MPMAQVLSRAIRGQQSRPAVDTQHIWKRESAFAPQRSSVIDDLRRTVLAPPAHVERFHAIFFDQNRARSGSATLGSGNACAVSISLRELFASAISARAHGMILAHNHPSGRCYPSTFDIEATTQIARMGRALGVELIDHLIFTETSVYSMRGLGEL